MALYIFFLARFGSHPQFENCGFLAQNKNYLELIVQYLKSLFQVQNLENN